MSDVAVVRLETVNSWHCGVSQVSLAPALDLVSEMSVVPQQSRNDGKSQQVRDLGIHQLTEGF
jgi:hypothetical protein